MIKLKEKSTDYNLSFKIRPLQTKSKQSISAMTVSQQIEKSLEMTVSHQIEKKLEITVSHQIEKSLEMTVFNQIENSFK